METMFSDSDQHFVYSDSSDRSVVRRRDPSLGRLSRVVSGQMGYDACDVSVWDFGVSGRFITIYLRIRCIIHR